MTIVVVTNLIQQARRLADRIAFLHAGRLVETGPTPQLFSDTPADPLTRHYLSGEFG
jgi:phosphate transport system ATP-binding protein